jgi:hypothetical protein
VTVPSGLFRSSGVKRRSVSLLSLVRGATLFPFPNSTVMVARRLKKMDVSAICTHRHHEASEVLRRLQSAIFLILSRFSTRSRETLPIEQTRSNTHGRGKLLRDQDDPPLPSASTDPGPSPHAIGYARSANRTQRTRRRREHAIATPSGH